MARTIRPQTADTDDSLIGQALSRAVTDASTGQDEFGGRDGNSFGIP